MVTTPRSSTRNGGVRAEHGSKKKPNSIVTQPAPTVKQERANSTIESRKRGRPGRPKTRRQSHGSAWHWRQTDAWYYTQPGTKKRLPLFDESGERIRGKDNKEQARLALARVKLANRGEIAPSPLASGDWIVARVCSEYIQHCDRGVANGSISLNYRANTSAYLNDLCQFCGALPLTQLKKSHIRTWVEQHKGWKSPATERSVLATVIAAFN